MYDLSREVNQRVETRAYKMDLSSEALTIDDLKLLSEGTQGKVCLPNVFLADLVLIH